MKIYESTIRIPGAAIGPENPLPVFCDPQEHKMLENNGTLKEKEKENLGRYNGFKVLPYRMQDRFSRELKERRYKTIVIENDMLRAAFLPQYGGRLYSLYDKTEDRELLFKNRVFQPANLAIRGAWFSGGIEWNVGRLGHSCSTCDDVFFARINSREECCFLRVYDYVRTTGIVWQIDFHLPDHSKLLYAHVKIINAQERKAPIYWWTNTAVKEEKKVRIFSGAKDVIYIDPGTLKEEGAVHGYGHGEMPYLEVLPEKDASYPMNFYHSSEYFFQNPAGDESPWEAAVYEDGTSFFERSTQPLRTRKMFCWGMHEGGRNWENFLSEPDQGDYVELQAGILPTQVHGKDMEPWETIEFTQVFGSVKAGPEITEENDWTVAGGRLCLALEEVCSADQTGRHDEIYRLEAIKPCEEILHTGHGAGYLEQSRRSAAGGRPLPESMAFPVESVSGEEKIWIGLLRGESMPDINTDEIPGVWMTDRVWEPYLRGMIGREPVNAVPYIHLGVLLYENGERDEAMHIWRESIKHKDTAIASRNLAWAYREKGKLEEALHWMKRAYMLMGEKQEPAMICEYLELLQKAKKYEEMMQLYDGLNRDTAQDDRMVIIMSTAAFHLKRWEFLERAFERPFAIIREGENQMCDLWYRYKAYKLAGEQAEEGAILETVKAMYNPPSNIDFRLAK